MATPQSQGGLGAMTPVRPPAPNAQPAQPPNPAQAAQRISGLEQETPAEEDFMERALRNKRAQEAALNSQIEALKNSLDSRMKPAFDPALMAAASGFLKPTKTGGFGESAGYAAEAYASETDKELARRQAVDKAKLELAQKQAAMQSQNLMFEHQMQMAGYDPKELTTLVTGPAGGSPLAGAPVGGAPAAGGAPTEGAPAAKRAPREPRMITERDIQMAYAISPEYGKQVMDQAKFQQDDLISTAQGTISKRTRQSVDTGLETSIETSLPFVGVEKVTQGQLAKIRKLDEQYPAGHPQRADQFARFYSANGIGGTSYTPPAAGQPSSAESSMRTASQRKLDEEAASETQKARIKESEARGNALIDYGQKADKIKQIALDMTSFADSNPRAFNLMQDATFVDSLKRSIEKNGGVFKIDPRTIDQYKLTGKDLEALQMFNQKSAQLTTEMRKASRAPGEGATDKKEGELYAAVEALPTDTARVIILKSELLILRSDFDRMAAEKWVEWRDENPGKSFDKFRLASKEYKELRNGYEDALDRVRKANASMLGTANPSQRQESTPQGNPPAPSGNRGNTRVVDGYIWERDDKGGWNNTGRKAK
jgi:hypothetical protein